MQRMVVVGDLPEAPLDAAAVFYHNVLPALQEGEVEGEDSLVLLFAPADHTHRGWRTAALASLARTLAPRRVNGVATPSCPHNGAPDVLPEAAREALSSACHATLAWLETAPGVTGQLLDLDT